MLHRPRTGFAPAHAPSGSWARPPVAVLLASSVAIRGFPGNRIGGPRHASQHPRSTRTAAAAAATGPELFDGFGELHRDIGSRVPAAQRYFDQGLRMAYGFNHEAAGRSFAEAARLDPRCAIWIWGQALVLGPNINLPMDPGLAKDATALAQRAVELAANATPADRALIHALRLRYANPAPEDRKPLDLAYAEAMAKVVHDFPGDDDAATLYAEALMDLTPWAYWTAEGQQTEHTPRIIGALERVLARNPRHIGAMHYYIHATEASPTPERALPYADALAALAPGSGHLVHMPAHAYIRVGRYHDATLTNFAATTADKAFLSVCRGTNGVYPLGYLPHNWDFAMMTAGLTGSRGMAHARSGRLEQAARDAEALHATATDPAIARTNFGMNNAEAVLRIADSLLRGELLRARGRNTEALAPLREAAGAADSERGYRDAWQWADAPLTASRY